MGVLDLELDQFVSRYLPANGVSIHVGVDSNNDAGSYYGNVSDRVVDGVSTVDFLSHPL